MLRCQSVYSDDVTYCRKSASHDQGSQQRTDKVVLFHNSSFGWPSRLMTFLWHFKCEFYIFKSPLKPNISIRIPDYVTLSFLVCLLHTHSLWVCILNFPCCPGSLAEWLADHPVMLGGILPMVLQGIVKPELSVSSVSTLKRICRECRHDLSPYAQDVLTVSQVPHTASFSYH